MGSGSRSVSSRSHSPCPTALACLVQILAVLQAFMQGKGARLSMREKLDRCTYDLGLMRDKFVQVSGVGTVVLLTNGGRTHVECLQIG